MLYFPQTRIELSNERPVLSGYTIPAEGCALVGVLSGGVYGLRASASTDANATFAGVSLNQPIQPNSLPFIENVVVAANGQIVLSNTPIGGTLYVLDTNTNTALSSTASNPTTGQYSADAVLPNAIDTNVANAGHTISVAYRYSPTVMQAMLLQGNVLPGGAAGAYLGQVGTITRGDIFTTEFDTSLTWATAVGVTLGANGIFSPTTNASLAIPGVQIIQLPSVSTSYLGLFINVPN